MTITTTAGRRCVDLGRLDPACTAARHGTASAYKVAKCRCPHAREANRLYAKRQREGRSVPVMVDACGTRRRIQGLWRLGHSSTTIAAECGERFDRRWIERLCRQGQVTPGTRDMIARAYRVLMNRTGRTAWTRHRARVAGYALPVQWGADIDDPNAVPEPLESEGAGQGFVDEAAVELALTGAKVPLTDDELVAAVRMGAAREISYERLAALLRIDHRAVKTIAGGGTPPRLGALVRRRLALVQAA